MCQPNKADKELNALTVKASTIRHVHVFVRADPEARWFKRRYRLKILAVDNSMETIIDHLDYKQAMRYMDGLALGILLSRLK